MNPYDAICGDSPPVVGAHPGWDVEFHGHFIGPFDENLKESLINELINLCWHSIALGDEGHGLESPCNVKPGENGQMDSNYCKEL
jgi:hypothetical protein